MLQAKKKKTRGKNPFLSHGWTLLYFVSIRSGMAGRFNSFGYGWSVNFVRLWLGVSIRSVMAGPLTSGCALVALPKCTVYDAALDVLNQVHGVRCSLG